MIAGTTDLCGFLVVTNDFLQFTLNGFVTSMYLSSVLATNSSGFSLKYGNNYYGSIQRFNSLV